MRWWTQARCDKCGRFVAQNGPGVSWSHRWSNDWAGEPTLHDPHRGSRTWTAAKTGATTMSSTALRTARRDWRIGDRVTRPIYLDDGTWTREGNGCLPGPLKHGAVELLEKYGDDMLFHVIWDNGTRGRYFWHGIDAEVAS